MPLCNWSTSFISLDVTFKCAQSQTTRLTARMLSFLRLLSSLAGRAVGSLRGRHVLLWKCGLAKSRPPATTQTRVCRGGFNVTAKSPFDFLWRDLRGWCLSMLAMTWPWCFSLYNDTNAKRRKSKETLMKFNANRPLKASEYDDLILSSLPWQSI